ncbi:MAG: acyltransferase domain-containing protein [Chitinivibrionales bacterium]|nr:acyltransferase domain-containing protein [Chitinivibrionales bacterium]
MTHSVSPELRKTAFLFPGQGSQEVGMGADLFESSEYFRSLVAIGSEMVQTDLKKVCLRGPERELIKPSRLQSLLCAVSLAYCRELLERGIKPDVILGHSLGEITSLGAAGVTSPDDTMRIAAYRGQLMDETAERVSGGMMAVLFVSLEDIEALLAELNAPDRIVLANDNAPDQVVLSGDNEILADVERIVGERTMGKCRRIGVIGPWHSHYMTEARHTFEDWAEPIPFARPHTPFILNALAREESHPSTIKHLVTYQLTSPVYWRESMNRLHEMGVNTLIEVGPGRVLSGLARVNGFKKGAELYNANNLRGIDTIADSLHGR